MSAATPATKRPPLWRDVRVLRVAFQATILALVAALVSYLLGNLGANTTRLGMPTGLDYLDQPAGFAIPHTGFDSGDSVLAALRYGVVNTAIVSFAGIVLASMLGLVVGVARLSSNWLVRRAAAVYVETLRNVPVLLIIIFWWLAVLLQLPPAAQGFEVADAVFLSNRGLTVPSFTIAGNPVRLLAVTALAVAAAGGVALWHTRRSERTGQPHHRLRWAAGVLLLASGAGYVATGAPLRLSLPERGGFGPSGGETVSIEFAALLLGLVLYTASHIAEIVRGSILAVPRGQSEAATALGLSGFQRMRYVVLPQAFRIVVPPLANQYLNLTKNSSLGVAVGYYELMKVTQVTIAQGGPAPQAVALLMLVYLGFSLTISAAANLGNRRLLATSAR